MFLDRCVSLRHLIAACGLLAGCARPAAAPLAARATPSALELTNGDTVPVYFRLVERRMDALLDWAPCRELARCPSVPPGARQLVPYDSIFGYRPDAAEVLVHWWRLAPPHERGGRATIDSVRTLVVPLRRGVP
jgi:hypothetical protein